MTKFINLTPHTVVEMVTGEVFEPSGTVARVSTHKSSRGDIGGVPVYVVTFGNVEGIPAPKEDIMYIVSGMVLEATDRKDVVAPGDLVRDKAGKPIGCKGFKVKG